MNTEEYLRSVIMDKIGGKAVLLGYDNRIGSDQLDPVRTGEICERLGLEVIMADKVDGPEAGVTISSTVIRNLLSEGKAEAASEMLGYEYSLYGVVVAGNRFGRRLGFPTANMQLYEPLKLVPANGVYLVRVETLGRKYYGMCNIGVRLRVGSGNAKTIETNIFDFDEDIYGLDIRISFIRKLRDEILFPDLESLGRQLKIDRDMSLAILGEKVRG
jgi:riboflavin kinase/FMN adenylyltransferase